MAQQPPLQPHQGAAPPKRRKKKSSKISPKTIRTLAVVWIGIVIMVGACVFLGIIWAVAGNNSETVASAQDVPAQADQPTPIADAQGESADAPVAAPASTAVPTIPPNQDDSFGYGIQVRMEMNTDVTLDQVNQLGLTWVKQQVRWKDLEPVQGQPNWDALGTILDAASERDIKVMVSVLAAPDWARSVTGEDLEGPPDDPNDYANYVAEMIRRFPGQIHAVEVWNEQNIEREWYAPGGITAESYVELLRVTHDAVRAVDPNVIIISGALAPTGVNNTQVRDDIVFMQEMINAGMLNYTDCVGSHANGYNVPPAIAFDEGYNDPTAIFRGPFDNPTHPSWSFYSTLTSYNSLVVAAGEDTPQCVTEFGWSSVEGMTGEPKEGFEFAYDNSLEEQAENIVDAYRIMHEWGFVKLAFLFNLDYSPKAGGNPQDDTTLFSITDPQGAPRPAFEAVRDMPKPP